MQMPARLLHLCMMGLSQCAFVTAPPYGTRVILSGIHICVFIRKNKGMCIPNKMQANNFKPMPYFKYTGIN